MSTLEIPKGPLSTDVEYKAEASLPLRPSPSPEGTVGEAIESPQYTPEQDKTWAQLFSRQEQILQNKACNEYLDGRTKMSFPSHSVAKLADASRALHKYSSWQVVRVNGFVPQPIFFKLLEQKCFPCTDFLRHPNELEYTPAPDMFHDLMGHLPMITQSRFASFFHAFGRAGVNARNELDTVRLGRIYWYTVEFGLMNPTAHLGHKRVDSECRIYGAGISSSVGEIANSLSHKVQKLPFKIEQVANTDYDIHHMQPFLFEISSFDELESEFLRWAKAEKLL